MKDLDQVAKDYGRSADERKLAQGLIDVGTYQGKVSDFVPRFADFGVHPTCADGNSRDLSSGEEDGPGENRRLQKN